MGRVGVALKRQHSDRAHLGVDNPVFGDVGLSVVGHLFDRIALGIVRTDHLGYQVGTKPVAILAARVAGLAHQQNIRLALLAGPHLKPERGHKHLSAQRLQESPQQIIEKQHDYLMFIRWQGQNLDHPIGELYQMPRLIGQSEILLFGPQALKQAQIDAEPIDLTDQFEVSSAYIRNHRCTSPETMR